MILILLYASVDSFGDLQGNLLIVGLAPFHGANKQTVLSGDYAGNILYETLYELKYTNYQILKAKMMV